ncbi:MAG: PQQ-dependent sugar dehydrogenase, partial [Gammaproteobacteria bacterium]|nr:PQQ-dependent sugar dehydrogenase [Gammaproteobacteria bacterium]
MRIGHLDLLGLGTALLAVSFGLAVAAEPLPLKYVDQRLQLPGREVVIQLPAGSQLELLADNLEGPRLLTFAENGDLFIGSKSGRVYRLPAPYTAPQVLISTKGYPHNVALRQNEILIAQKDGLYHAPYQLGQARIAPDKLRLLAELPGGGGHSSRTVAIGPDKRVYLSLGISGNCSDEYLSEGYPFSDRRGGILVLNETGPQAIWQTFASGLRNPVGFAWHPQTGELYASNNGPDHQGYDLPPEYFSKVPAGSFHGMPWFQYDGKRIQPDDCIKRPPPHPIDEVIPPVATFPARSAPMGVAFVPEGAMHKTLAHDAIVA